MNPWTFEATGLPTLKKQNAFAIKVELTYQALSPWWGASPTQLAQPDFSTGNVNSTEFPFTIPDRLLVSNAEPGCAGNAASNIEAINRFCGADGTTVASGDLAKGRWYKVFTDTVDYNSVTYQVGQTFQAVSGVATYSGSGSVQRNWTLLEILQADYADYDIHIRISTKDTGGAYIVKYWGIVDGSSITFEPFDISKPQTWMMKFSADDCLQQLERVRASSWMNATAGGLKHADFDYSATATYLTYVGDYTTNSVTYPAGQYAFNGAFRKDFRNDDGEWYYYNQMRWIKIVDIFQSISDFLNLEASVNDGGSWSDFHSWRFYYNTHSPAGAGGETLSYVGIDELYVFADFWDGASYVESYGFFDPQIEPSAPHSWKTSGSPLEVLDRICSSFGLTFRIRVNSSNQRYLEIIEYAKIQSTLTISGSDWNDVLEYNSTENTFSCSGVEVVSTGSSLNSSNAASNVSKGNQEGSGTLKYDTFFLSTNFLRVTHEFRKKYSKDGVVDIRPMDTDFTCALWTLQDITSMNADNAYSICMIMPRDNDTAASGTPTIVPEFAEYDSGLGGVVVPKRTGSGTYHTYIEMPGMALVCYLWDNNDINDNPVGFVRPNGDELEITLVGVDHTAQLYPPIKLVIDDKIETRVYTITEIEESEKDDTTTYRGHTRDV